MDKLDKWMDDRKTSLKSGLDTLGDAVKEAKKAIRDAESMPEKLSRRRDLRVIESKYDAAWKEYENVKRDLDSQKDALIDDVSLRLEQQVKSEELFSIRWGVV